MALETFELPDEPDRDSDLNWKGVVRPLDLNKAHSTIKQFWRDWSKEGFNKEVEPILKIILNDLADNLGPEPYGLSILLPGAGLGRLLFELCLAGYNAEGNEISYHQLLASNFILNTTQRANQFKLYPFVTTFNNHLSRRHQMRWVTIPDVHPGAAIAEKTRLAEADDTHQSKVPGQMNMTAGDFITSYSTAESARSFDAVVTVYFIDTAPNLIRYIETIRNCLKEGGIWVNVGPLLWHFEDRIVDKHDVRTEDEDEDESEDREKDKAGIAEPGSFELTNEEVLALVQNMGFDIITGSVLPSTAGGYIQDPDSMLQNMYNCSHWIARKTSQCER